MTGWLTTHVLDTARGCPASGLKIDLYRLSVDAREHLHSAETNADGRTDTPMLPEAEFRPGTYELVFHVDSYFESLDLPEEHPRFLSVVPIRFGMSEAAHYHVPLLLSPYGYSTYRGS